MKRLVSYGNNMLDYHVILDLLPSLASLYFSHRFAGDVKLSGVQSAILLALGLQRKEIEAVEAELKLPVAQALALFVKIVRRLTTALEDVQKKEIEASIPDGPANGGDEAAPRRKISAAQAMRDELEEEGDEITKQLRAQQREVIDSLDLSKYAIAGQDADFENVKDLSKVVSVRNPEGAKRKQEEEHVKPSAKNDSGKKHKKPKH